jgi:hypothetical protein
MATMTMEPETIKTAMRKIGLEDRADALLALLDEIELDRRLKISMEQADKGQTMSLEELKSRVEERFKSGYYYKQ